MATPIQSATNQDAYRLFIWHPTPFGNPVAAPPSFSPTQGPPLEDLLPDYIPLTPSPSPTPPPPVTVPMENEGTRPEVPYKPYVETNVDADDMEKSIVYAAISLMPQYVRHSFEELRLRDYHYGRRFYHNGQSQEVSVSRESRPSTPVDQSMEDASTIAEDAEFADTPPATYKLKTERNRGAIDNEQEVASFKEAARAASRPRRSGGTTTTIGAGSQKKVAAASFEDRAANGLTSQNSDITAMQVTGNQQEVSPTPSKQSASSVFDIHHDQPGAMLSARKQQQDSPARSEQAVRGESPIRGSEEPTSGAMQSSGSFSGQDTQQPHTPNGQKIVRSVSATSDQLVWTPDSGFVAPTTHTGAVQATSLAPNSQRGISTFGHASAPDVLNADAATGDGQGVVSANDQPAQGASKLLGFGQSCQHVHGAASVNSQLGRATLARQGFGHHGQQLLRGGTPSGPSAHSSFSGIGSPALSTRHTSVPTSGSATPNNQQVSRSFGSPVPDNHQALVPFSEGPIQPLPVFM